MRLKDASILLAPVIIAVLSMVAIPFFLLPSEHPLSPPPEAAAPADPASPAATPASSGATTPEPAAGASSGETTVAAASPAAAQPAAGKGDAQNGAKLFAPKGCGACHTIAGVEGASGTIGPELSHIATVAQTRKPGVEAEAYIRESIQTPAAHTVEGFAAGLMPTLPLTESELDDIVAMLLTHQ